jgi:hypothetical protein
MDGWRDGWMDGWKASWKTTTTSFIIPRLNPVLNAQVCVYLTIHYIYAKRVYYIMTAKCRRRHAAAYRPTQNAFPYFWSNKSQNLFLKNH